MSYTTIKAIWPGEKHEDLVELGNSWRSAPVVWNRLAERYLGSGTAWLTGDKTRLWKLVDRKDVPQFMRRVLMMTFDRAYVLKKDYAKAAADIRRFMLELPQSPDFVCNWPKIAEIFESDPDIPAIGFHHTSVSEDPFLGPRNEETDEYEPTDWSKCWSIYDEDLDAETEATS